MTKNNNGKKKLLQELNEVLGEDKVLELFFLIKAQQKDLTKFYQDLLVKQGYTTEEVRTQTETLLKKIDDIGQIVNASSSVTRQVEVINQPEPTTEIKVTNFPKQLPYPKEVSIKGLAEDLSDAVAEPIRDTLRKQLQNVTLTGPTDPRKAIAVRLSDGKTFYTALNQIIQTGNISADELAIIVDLLTKIEDNTKNIQIHIDDLTIDTGQLEELNGSGCIDLVGEDDILTTGEETLVTYDVPTGYKMLLKGAYFSGDGEGLFRLKFGEVDMIYWRNNWCDRGDTKHFEAFAPEGETITIVVKNRGKNTNHYQVGFWGYLIKLPV